MLEAASILLKTISYAACLTTAGPILAICTLRPVLPSSAVASVVRVAALVLVAAALATCGLYVLRLGGSWDPPTLQAIFISPIGLALGLQLIAGSWLATRGRGFRLPAALLLIASLVVSGHASARGWVAMSLLMVHLVGAAWWLGGLCELLAQSRQLSTDAFSHLVSRFGSQAITLVMLLIGAGLALSGVLLRFAPDLTQAYERTLIVKLGWVLLLVVIAAINRHWLTSALKRSAQALTWLRYTILAELCLFLAILVTTAVLTAYIGLHDRRPPAPRIVAELSGLFVIDPRIAATPPRASVAAGYVVFRNNDTHSDRLLGASSSRAAHVAVHEVSTVGDLVFMQEQIEGIALPAHSELALSSGVRHLMFEDIDAPFVEGDVVDVTLQFERRGSLEVLFLVQRGTHSTPSEHMDH